MLKHWKSSAIAALGIVLAVSFVAGVAHFEPKKWQAEQAAKNHSETDALNILASERVAYYTKVLAIFTGGLAAFGVLQILFLIRADQNVRDQIKLSRDEFNATHRPKVIVRAFRITSHRELLLGHKIVAIFTAQNIGESTANLVEVRSATIIADRDERLDDDYTFVFGEPLSYALKSGTKELVPVNGGRAPEGNEAMEMWGGSKVLYVIGTLAYVDDAGLRRMVGFCRRYIPRDDRWEVVESGYEYAY